MGRDSDRDTEPGSIGSVDTELEILLRQVAHVSATGMLPVLPRPGEVIDGKYRLVARIGVGGMGAVFSAVHLVTEKAVAVKWLLRPTSDARARRRFLREARIAGRVAHPNLVDVYDVGEVGQNSYLVMELLRGESLRERLERGRLSPQELVDWLVPALHGVAAMHAAGVIHRDLKPDNIFLCLGEDGSVQRSKVLDFGLSSLVSFNATEATLTQDGMFAGTPAYAAPERMQSERDTDERSDIYSLGVILYESLTGRLPIMADSYPALVLAITTQEPERPSKLRPELSPELDAIVLRALAKRREQRFADVHDLIAALVPFASAPIRVERVGRRRRWLVPVAGLALLAALLIGGSLLRPAPRAAPQRSTLAGLGLPHFAAVGGEVACESCLARGCQAERAACAAQEPCARVVRAAQSARPPVADRTFLGLLFQGHWDADHGQAPYMRTRDRLMGCARQQCAEVCEIGRHFECVGQFEWPSSYPSRSQLRVRLVPLDDPELQLSSWQIRACAPGAACERLMGQATTDAAGFATLTLDLTNLRPNMRQLPEYAGRVELYGGDAFYPQATQLSAPLLDGWYMRYGLASRQQIAASHGPRGLPVPDATRGLLQVQPQDCEYRVGRGLRLEVWQAGPEGYRPCGDCKIGYADATGIPNPALREYGSDSLSPAEVAVASGEYLVQLRETATNRLVSTLSGVDVRAGHETSIVMFPASRSELDAAPVH